ncbi:polyprenol monophosphomannose synthase [Sediminitomix flava]|uniref:Dolichol-phosphate mannosyltransferase n=1 Tax=Sediminitomix flava TaxID=379075 RepID=A0A315ZD86_SEDFL|nr:polyprenol monophosphomannose synthase [Sediminitomix flava]PWJ42818.1 dolichol-phosphate mannosyltransferase [Sediminitomix flava]
MVENRENIVIIPTYNEIENIEDILRAVVALEVHFDIMVVDDNSPDGTAQKVMELAEEFPNQIILEQRTEKSGLGTAYIHGFKKALALGYQYIFEMDADFSHNPKDLIRLYEACSKEGNDLAVGSRYIRGVNVVNWPMSRVLLSFFAGVYVRMITGMKIMDPTAGFKCFSRKVLETIDLDNIRFVGYAFQIEMKFKSWKRGFKIKEVPIIFTDRTKGESKMSHHIIKEAVFGVISMTINSWFSSSKK